LSVSALLYTNAAGKSSRDEKPDARIIADIRFSASANESARRKRALG